MIGEQIQNYKILSLLGEWEWEQFTLLNL